MDKTTPTPKYFELLNVDDQKKYHDLRSKCSSAENRYQYNQALEIFKDTLDKIKRYCIQNDDFDSKRFLVCGVCWLDDASIAINTAQLSLLISKCKAAINNYMQSLGYMTINSRKINSIKLHHIIPQLITDYTENRKWSIRKINMESAYITDNEQKNLKDIYQNQQNKSIPEDVDWDFRAEIYGQSDGDNAFL